MQKIYIAKPGAQKEGPYTLEQINRDIAAKKITETDFWAWHEGLPSWLPLHSVPGVSAKAVDTVAPEAEPPRARNATADPIARQVKAVSNHSKSESAAALAATSQPDSLSGATSTTPADQPRTETPKSAAATAREVQPQPVTPRPLPQPIAAPARPKPTTAEVETRSVSVARSESETLDVEAKSPPGVQPEPLVSKAETVVEQVAKPGAERMKAETATAAAPAPAAPEAEPLPKAPAEFPAALMSSGKPFTALEQIFVLTTGDGPATLKSELTVAMLSEAAGEKSEHILGKVPVDVIGGAAARVLETIRAGTIPNSVWRNLFKIKASIAQQIQDGMYHLCIRTFPVESEELVALFLLYNKQRL